MILQTAVTVLYHFLNLCVLVVFSTYHHFAVDCFDDFMQITRHLIVNKTLVVVEEPYDETGVFILMRIKCRLRHRVLFNAFNDHFFPLNVEIYLLAHVRQTRSILLLCCCWHGLDPPGCRVLVEMHPGVMISSRR